MKEERVFLYEGKPFFFLFEAKRVKNLNLRVKSDGTVSVSAPPRASRDAVEQFVRSHMSFILSARERIAKREAEKPPPPAEGSTVFYLGVPYRLTVREGREALSFFAGEAILTCPATGSVQMHYERALAKLFYPVLVSRCRAVEPAFFALGVKAPREIRLRHMTSMWGNCRARTGVLTFSILLAEKPLPLIDYVVAHEYTHFLHPDHSASFYRVLSGVCPDYKEKRAALRRSPPYTENGTEPPTER